ncbi:MAG: glycosyltransferase [Actinobacteria bacterium]|nr:glycosyltransferase [Actinomycetota bacterium]
MSPSVLHLSTYDTNGGAARAADALHRAMLQEGVDSTLRTAAGTRFRLASELDRQLWRLQTSPTKTWRSPARFGSLSAHEINSSQADVVNLHWVTDGFLSVEEIGRITKPVVWSLYDMWPFAGTEHYGADTPDARWREGYTRANRPGDESGVDLDRWTWQRKQRHWTKPMAIVAASTWLQDRAQNSALMGAWPHHRIPHVIDCHTFGPMPMNTARGQLGLPADVPLILFLASAGITDRRKGWDLLDQALGEVRAAIPDVEVVIVGPRDVDYRSPSGTPIHWRGSIDGNEALALHYNAANVTAVPSREDNMPLTAMEAQSCGRPVVAFRIGGLPDIIEHHVTGYLAPEGNTALLAEGLTQALNDSLHQDNWGRAARQRALRTWSTTPVVEQYQAVYAQAMR